MDQMRDLPFTLDDLAHAENFLAQGDVDRALPYLQDLRVAAEDYIASACVTTDEVQYFSFADEFEWLAYRRVERDPRRLVPAPLPFDRLYAALGFAYIRQNEFTLARDALMQAVRWDPMNCAHRLNLAGVFRTLGNAQEWASLSHSVIERASDPVSAARAYVNLALFFMDEENAAAAEGCVRAARRLAEDDALVAQAADRMAAEHPEAAELTDAEAAGALESAGVSAEPNAEMAVCLIMCATDAAAQGKTDEATRFTIRARDLVGAPAAKALIQLVREADAELRAEREGAAPAGAAGVSATDGAAEEGNQDA